MSSLKIETICLDPESEVSWERVMDMSIEKLVSFRKKGQGEGNSWIYSSHLQYLILQ